MRVVPKSVHDGLVALRAGAIWSVSAVLVIGVLRACDAGEAGSFTVRIRAVHTLCATTGAGRCAVVGVPGVRIDLDLGGLGHRGEQTRADGYATFRVPAGVSGQVVAIVRSTPWQADVAIAHDLTLHGGRGGGVDTTIQLPPLTFRADT